jgi:hypothetical protein
MTLKDDNSLRVKIRLNQLRCFTRNNKVTTQWDKQLGVLRIERTDTVKTWQYLSISVFFNLGSAKYLNISLFDIDYKHSEF